MDHSMTEAGPPNAWQQEDEQAIDTAALLRQMRGGGKLIGGVSLAALLLATVVAFFVLKPAYTSTAAFIPPNLGGNTPISSAIAGQLSVLGGAGLGKNAGDLYAGILRSRSVAQELVHGFDLAKVYEVKRESDAEKILAANTAVVVEPKSSIVTLNVTDKSPERAQKLANAYMEALREADGRLALGQSSQRRLFFGRQLAKEKDDLEDAEVELKKTEEQSGLIAPAGQTEAEIKTISETQGQLAAREVQLAALRQAGTEQNPQVIRLRSEIGDLQGQLARLQNGGGRGSGASIPTARVPELQLEYVRKEREVKYHEALFETLSRQYEAARLDEAHDAPMLQVLDSASYPDVRSGPRRTYIILGGLMVGFVASSLWVLLRSRLH